MAGCAGGNSTSPSSAPNNQQMLALNTSGGGLLGVYKPRISYCISARGEDILGGAGEEHGEGVDSSWKRPELLTTPCLIHVQLEQVPSVYHVCDFCLYFGP